MIREAVSNSVAYCKLENIYTLQIVQLLHKDREFFGYALFHQMVVSEYVVRSVLERCSS